MPKEYKNNEENHINKKLNNFNKNFLEECNDSKRFFFQEVKAFKKDLLGFMLHNTASGNNQEQIITLLHSGIILLKKQLQLKDKIIDFLIKQLPLQNQCVTTEVFRYPKRNKKKSSLNKRKILPKVKLHYN